MFFDYDYEEGATADEPYLLGWLVGWLVGWRHIINIPPTLIVCSNTNDQEPGQNRKMTGNAKERHKRINTVERAYTEEFLEIGTLYFQNKILLANHPAKFLICCQTYNLVELGNQHTKTSNYIMWTMCANSLLKLFTNHS